MKLFATRPPDVGESRPQGPGTISTDVSVQVPPSVQPSPKEHNWERREREAKEVQTAVVGALEQIQRSVGGILDLTRAAPVGDCLRQGTYQVTKTSGFWTSKWDQHYLSVGVANLSTHKLTVISSGPVTAVPTVGNGVLVLPSGYWRLVPMEGNALTVYGTPTHLTPAPLFDIAVFIRPRTPGAGPCGV